MKTKPHIFKTFPEFSKLTLADKERYEKLAKGFPPLSDLTFGSLMSVWNPLDTLAISQIGDCVVISYFFPGDEDSTGLCIVGDKGVDEAFCAVFDWQKARGEEARLVHVPEFTASSVRFPELYKFEAERKHDECVIPISKLCEMGQLIHHKRWKVRRFMAEVDGGRVELRSLDLADAGDAQLLRDAAGDWKEKGGFNDLGSLEEECLRLVVDQAEALGFENACLYIDGKLHAFLLYQQPNDKRYVIMRHVKATHPSTRNFELISYKFAEWFAKHDIAYVNITSDLGSLRTRMLVLAMGPTNFIRKYTIEPAS